MLSYNNIIYFTKISYNVAKVWRLEGKDSWVLEGENKSKELWWLVPHLFAFEPARRALHIGDLTKRDLLALHLSSSRSDILYQWVEFPDVLFHSPLVVYGTFLWC